MKRLLLTLFLAGIMYHLGTFGGTQPWMNPAEAGFVVVTTSGLMGDSAPASAAVGRETCRCVTQPVPNAWFCFDLLDLTCAPTAYSLRHYSSWDNECLRNWVLEASADGMVWEALANHTNDTSLEHKGATKTWRLNSMNKRFRMFRVLQTGRNSNQNFYLPCSGFELWVPTLCVVVSDRILCTKGTASCGRPRRRSSCAAARPRRTSRAPTTSSCSSTTPSTSTRTASATTSARAAASSSSGRTPPSRDSSRSRAPRSAPRRRPRRLRLLSAGAH